MNAFFFCLMLINAAASAAAGAAVWWRNRSQPLGPAVGLTMVVLGIWAGCFAQYFVHLPAHTALVWGKWTLTMSVLSLPLFLYSMCAAAERERSYRGWITVSFLCCGILLMGLWKGSMVTGLSHPPYLDHFLRCQPGWHAAQALYEVVWPTFGITILAIHAHRSTGYRRTQLLYFIIASATIFLTTTLIIVPLEYGIDIPPFGFLLLPIDLALLTYVMVKARLADYNVVIARVFLYAVTMAVIAAISLAFIGGVALMSPSFMSEQQLLFSFMLSMAIGAGLTAGLPRFLPRAERMMQERMFRRRYGYQDALAGLVRELSVLPTIDAVLSTVATTLHTQMHVSRALVMLQDPLSGGYKLQAESGLGPEDDVETFTLPENATIIKWLQENRDELVRDEMARRVPVWERDRFEAELKLLGVAVCVPMILDGRLLGLIGLGEKLNHDMFFVSDLRLLETLATEVALAVKYRHIEDEVFRKNRLIELGTIAAGVAHEIRNPLASIKTFAQLMPERIDDPEFRNEFGKLVLKDVDRITKVIESMLAFARPSQVNIKEQPANDLVEEAVLLVQPRLKAKHIELTRAFHGSPVVKVDKHQMLQVLVNLLGNAADALQERGKIRVATGLTQTDVSVGGNGNRNFAVIEVSDNGPGIPAAVRNRLFDPFFTTKKEGTGLGLSISQKIVRDHGGAITVSSVEGKGTTFQVNLPVN
ncbi:MAG TPA: ATP-binding protein [Verrucomicrobiae bacterium]|nr:ATP-binding protein [Verrucomicrobiae bacterium]